jgi:predicted membrane protein
MNLGNAPRGSLFALLLIVAGALLFLDNLGILPIEDIRAYWPIWIVVWGVYILDRRKSPVAIIWAVAIMACGVLLILGNLRIIHVTGGVIWPVLLIAFGTMMLVRPVRFGEWPERFRVAGRMRRRERFSRLRANGAPESFSGNELNEAIVFSSLNRRVETQQFEGGKLDVVFGSIELDLTGASISSANRQAAIEANAVFGGIEITVPRTWKIIMKSTAVFGGCDDRTVPPRPEPGFEPVTLVVTGGAVFGGISIQN